GRKDQQVKIRGYRIELGEIETALQEQERVRDVVVVAREEGGEKQLVAYVVGRERGRIGRGNELREYLKGRLPEYMVPAMYVELEKLPLTANGKVDRKALPDPDRTSDSAAYVPPRTLQEEMLCGVMEQILDIQPIGIRHNFFQLGGHSLLATQVVSRIRNLFGLELPLRILFEKPTVGEVAGELERLRMEGHELPVPAIKPVDRSRGLPLSFAQQRLWFIEQLGPGLGLYNMPFALRMQGQLQIDVLQKSLEEIVRRHQVLRTRFPVQDGEPMQEVMTSTALDFETIDLTGIDPQMREEVYFQRVTEAAKQGFDLEQGGLLRFKLFQLSEEECVLLVVMHHIVSDGWSMDVLRKEFMRLYEAYHRGKESPLPETLIQYADFAVWQREWLLQGKVLQDQLSYWRKQLQGVSVLELRTDPPRPPVPSHDGHVHFFQISRKLSSELQELSQKHGVTLFMT